MVLISACGDRKPPTSIQQEPVVREKPQLDAEGLGDYDWMLGTWLAHGMEYYEVWEKKNDSTFSAIVYKELGVDSTITERIELSERGGDYIYTPTVLSQNAGQPITFLSVQAKKNMIQFENMAHNFPNRIVYFKSSAQQMDVKIDGVQDGEVFQSYDIMMSKMED